jgi:hypothetical protein
MVLYFQLTDDSDLFTDDLSQSSGMPSQVASNEAWYFSRNIKKFFA